MAPPAVSASASASRPQSNTTTNYYPSTNTTNTNRNPQQNLYTSILAPPPAKQARTIHNPRDPPIAAPTRPPVTPKSQRGSGGGGAGVSGRPRALSLVEGTRSHDAKSRREEFGSSGTGTGDKRKRSTTSTTSTTHKNTHSQIQLHL
jgi:hypothetical protein